MFPLKMNGNVHGKPWLSPPTVKHGKGRTSSSLMMLCPKNLNIFCLFHVWLRNHLSASTPFVMLLLFNRAIIAGYASNICFLQKVMDGNWIFPVSRNETWIPKKGNKQMLLSWLPSSGLAEDYLFRLITNNHPTTFYYSLLSSDTTAQKKLRLALGNEFIRVE